MSSAAAPPPRRAATLPSRLQQPQQQQQPPDQPPPADDAVTLFAHAHTRIVAFGASIAGSNQSGWGTSRMVDAVPWSTRTERVVAAGPLRLYRLKSSDHVCFLHAGELLLSLLPRSQVWCVDAVSQFAIRIQPYIYRIELPVDTDADRKLLDDFKSVLSSVLYYERTPCPFKRGFAQDHAEDLPEPSARKGLFGDKKARKWELKKYWRPEGQEDYVPAYHSYSSTDSDDDGNVSASSTADASTPPERPRPVSVSAKAGRDRFDGSLPVRAGKQQPHVARVVTSPTKLADYQSDRYNRLGRASTFRDSVGYMYARDSGRVASMALQFSAVSIDSPASLPSVDPESPSTPVATQRLSVAKRAPGVVGQNDESAMSALAGISLEEEKMGDNLTPTVTFPGEANVAEVELAPSPEDSSESEADQDADQHVQAGTDVQDAGSEMEMSAAQPHMGQQTEADVLDEREAGEPADAASAASNIQPLPSMTAAPLEMIDEEAAEVSMEPFMQDAEAGISQNNQAAEAGISLNNQPALSTSPPHAEPLAQPPPPPVPNPAPSEPQPQTPPRPSTPTSTSASNPTSTPSRRPTLTLQTPPPAPVTPSSPTSATPSTARRRTASPRSHRRFRSNEIPSYILDDVAPPTYEQNLALVLSPANIVSKTCAILLGPPSGLVQIMVQIAARLRSAGASGAFRVTDHHTRSRALPGRWMDSDEEGAEDDEDDFGVPLGNITPARERRRALGFGSTLLQAPLPEVEEGGSYS